MDVGYKKTKPAQKINEETDKQALDKYFYLITVSSQLLNP